MTVDQHTSSAPTATKPTQKILYLTRHAQAEHNVANDYSIPDAPLTKLGRKQSQDLYDATKDRLQKIAELLVSSALRRPLSTMLIAYADLRKRLEEEGKPVIVLPQLQEANSLPCDTGSPREILEADPEYAGLDFSNLTPDWTSKQGFYGSSVEALKARARWVRRWLRDRPEQHIVVVAHGDILRYMTDGKNSSRPWANAEVKAYTFVTDDVEADEEAWLSEITPVAKKGGEAPTSSQAQEEA